MNDPESDHRELHVNMTIAQKLEQDIKHGYVERVDYQHVVQLDNLDPELLAGQTLTDTEKYWVQKKQARRAGPRSSSWPSCVPSQSQHDQHTEYIRMAEKAENRRDPNARECVECGSKLWGNPPNQFTVRYYGFYDIAVDFRNFLHITAKTLLSLSLDLTVRAIAFHRYIS
ncbi:hypothetical protein MBANPS3_010692 [Mucor bainieri]